MYAVFYTKDFNADLTSENLDVKLYKKYVCKNKALQCAWIRNRLISQQVLGRHYYVYDLENKECLSAVAA